MLTCKDCDVKQSGNLFDDAYAKAVHWVEHVGVDPSSEVFETVATGKAPLEQLFIGRAN